jgi:hypothetical protein
MKRFYFRRQKNCYWRSFLQNSCYQTNCYYRNKSIWNERNWSYCLMFHYRPMSSDWASTHFY